VSRIPRAIPRIQVMTAKYLHHPPDLAVPVTEQDHAQGPPDAPVTLVEYGDYECPWCGRTFPLIKRLQSELGDQLRVVYRNFPQSSTHPHASVAAQAAEAAAAQGKFWEMHDVLFEHQDELNTPDLVHYGLRIGVEVYRFQADLASERFGARVQADYDGGVRSGVTGTPTIFINGRRYAGKLEYDPMLSAVRDALNTRATSQSIPSID
jgi:protein-disulfide isomerase